MTSVLILRRTACSRMHKCWTGWGHRMC